MFVKRYKNPMSKAEWFKTCKFYVEPEEVVINKELKETFQHISIIKTLKALFKNKEFNFEYFKNDSTLADLESIDSFKKSSNFMQNKLFQESPEAIQIVLYMDDYQTG